MQTHWLLTQLAPAYLRRNKSVNAWRKPAKYPGVLNQWTQPELAQTLMNRGIVDNISASSVERFLNQEDLKLHWIKYKQFIWRVCQSWVHPDRPVVEALEILSNQPDFQAQFHRSAELRYRARDRAGLLRLAVSSCIGWLAIS